MKKTLKKRLTKKPRYEIIASSFGDGVVVDLSYDNSYPVFRKIKKGKVMAIKVCEVVLSVKCPYEVGERLYYCGRSEILRWAQPLDFLGIEPDGRAKVAYVKRNGKRGALFYVNPHNLCIGFAF